MHASGSDYFCSNTRDGFVAWDGEGERPVAASTVFQRWSGIQSLGMMGKRRGPNSRLARRCFSPGFSWMRLENDVWVCVSTILGNQLWLDVGVPMFTRFQLGWDARVQGSKGPKASHDMVHGSGKVTPPFPNTRFGGGAGGPMHQSSARVFFWWSSKCGYCPSDFTWFNTWTLSIIYTRGHTVSETTCDTSASDSLILSLRIGFPMTGSKNV